MSNLIPLLPFIFLMSVHLSLFFHFLFPCNWRTSSKTFKAKLVWVQHYSFTWLQLRSGHSCNTKNIIYTPFYLNFLSCYCTRIGIGRYFEAWAHITADWWYTTRRTTSFILAWGEKLGPIISNYKDYSADVILKILMFAGPLDAIWINGVATESSIPPAVRLIYLCESSKSHFFPFTFLGMLAGRL